MSAEPLHEIYDNDGTLIGYESAQVDPATGHFTRYDETRIVRGYAKDIGDLIYHYDKSMRLIGYARFEDGVLREYDRQSNVIGYQVRQFADSAQEDDSLPQYGSPHPNATAMGNGALPNESASPAMPTAQGDSIYTAPKAYSVSGNNWFGNRLSAEDIEIEEDLPSEEVTGPEITQEVAGDLASNIRTPSFDYRPASRENNSFREPAPPYRGNPRYEEIVNDEEGERSNTPDQAEAHSNELGQYGHDQPYNNLQQSQYASHTAQTASGYAMRGEIVDDVDDYGNEIDPKTAQPFWENMPQMPPDASASSPMAKRSPFASKPSLLQRLLARVMPFLGPKRAYTPSTVTRNPTAELPAPNRPAEATPAQPSFATFEQTRHPRYAQTDSQTAQPDTATSAQPNRSQHSPDPASARFNQSQHPREEIAEGDENFDPLAEFKIIWQKIKFYAEQLRPKHKADREDSTEFLDSRDAILNQTASESAFGGMDYSNGHSNSTAAFGNDAPTSPGMSLPDMLAFLASLPQHMRGLPSNMLRNTLHAVQTPLWLWWMTATALGAIAFGMIRLFIPPLSGIPTWYYGALYGAMMGIAQWAMLRHRFRTTWPWVMLSLSAGLVGSLLWGGEQSWLQAHSHSAGLGEMVMLNVILGIAQWLLLRNLSSRATYWLLLSPVAGVIGWLAYQIGSPVGAMGALTAHGLALGAVSGLALVHTVEDSSRSSLMQAPRNLTLDLIAIITMLTGSIRAIGAAIALGGLLEAISGNMSIATQGGQSPQTPILLALLSIYPARLFVSLASMGSALGYKQNESSQSRAWLVGASVAGILVEIIAQVVLPVEARPSGSGWFIMSSLLILVLVDTLTALPSTEEAPNPTQARTTLTSLSAIGILTSGLLIFFASVFTAVHSINVDLMATASLTADAIGFSISLISLISITRVLLSAFAIFVALRLPGDQSNGWAEVPLGVLAIAIATFGPMVLDTSTTTATDNRWIAPILLCGVALGSGLLRNAPVFGGALPTQPNKGEGAKRAAPRLVPVGVVIGMLSIGVLLSRSGMLSSVSKDPRFASVVNQAQDLRKSIVAQIGQVQVPKSMSEVQQSTAGIQQTVSNLFQKLQPTPEPTADWPPASK